MIILQVKQKKLSMMAIWIPSLNKHRFSKFISLLSVHLMSCLRRYNESQWRIHGEGQGCPDPPPPPNPFRPEEKIRKTNGLKLKLLPPKDRIWLLTVNFKNESCVVLRRSTKYQTWSNLHFFRLPSNGRLCSQSSRARRLQKHLFPEIWHRLSLWPCSFNRLKSNS